MSRLEASRKWKAKNRERIRAYEREYRKRPEVRVRASIRDAIRRRTEPYKRRTALWRAKNRDIIVQRHRTWNRNHSALLSSKSRARYVRNPQYFKARVKAYQDAHADAIHIAKVRNKFGLTQEQYAKLRKDYEDLCGICRRGKDYQRLGVDHDHKTGRVRGLLCARCNAGLGMFLDNPLLLEQAAQYLRKSVMIAV